MNFFFFFQRHIEANLRNSTYIFHKSTATEKTKSTAFGHCLIQFCSFCGLRQHLRPPLLPKISLNINMSLNTKMSLNIKIFSQYKNSSGSKDVYEFKNVSKYKNVSGYNEENFNFTPYEQPYIYEYICCANINSMFLFKVLTVLFTPGAQPEFFQGRGGLVGWGHFYKHFVKNSRKKGSAGTNLGVFSPRYSSNYILNGKCNSKMDTARAFFTKSGHFFFDFRNRAGETSPP